MSDTAFFYGACGGQYCTDCLPLFDRDNAEIPGTDDEGTDTSDLRNIAFSHDIHKFGK